MPNLSTIINSHNRKILEIFSNKQLTSKTTCNCKKKLLCPLNGNCQKKSIVYKTTLTTDNSNQYYFGLCETSLKTKQDLTIISNLLDSETKQKNSTELSQAIWNSKDNNKEYTLNWSTIKEVSTL